MRNFNFLEFVLKLLRVLAGDTLFATQFVTIGPFVALFYDFNKRAGQGNVLQTLSLLFPNAEKPVNERLDW